jgi:UDP-glucose 4-epimerase
MRVLITGGSGFLGRYLTKELMKRKITTVVYDTTLPDAKKETDRYSKNITYIKGDILDFKSLRKVMKECDLVFHTAAIAEIDEARRDPIRTINVNVMGTVNCLEAARLSGVERVLYASSVYASGNKGSFYRVSKQTGEALCKTYSDDFGLKYTILRYGSLYGRESNHWNFIYGVCKDLLVKGEYSYASSPDAVREYIHIDDAARETIRIAYDKEYINKSVLITGHQRLKMREFFETIQEILGKPITIHYESAKKQRHYIRTPYSFDVEVPIRINISNYVDINEGILDCLKEVREELNNVSNDRITHDRPHHSD